MEASSKQIAYEKSCRELLTGKAINGIFYAQYQIDDEEMEFEDEPLLIYETEHAELHALESFLYIKIDHQVCRFSWAVAHLDYGLMLSTMEVADMKKEEDYIWEVSSHKNWESLIGDKISDVSIIWEKSWSTNLLSTTPYEIIFPHTYIIKTENNHDIIISACLYDDDNVKPFIDSLKITTNMYVAKQLHLLH